MLDILETILTKCIPTILTIAGKGSSLQFQSTFKGHSDYIQCLASRENKKQFLSGSEDGTVRLWGENIALGCAETSLARMKDLYLNSILRRSFLLLDFKNRSNKECHCIKPNENEVMF